MVDHDKIFDTVIRNVTVVILYILLLALIVGLLKTLLGLGAIVAGIFHGDFVSSDFSNVVFNVLTVFVIIDLFKTLIDYREHERIRLTYITDATILLVMREITAGIYAQKIEYEFIISLSILLLVLGAIKVLAVKYSPDDIDDVDLSASSMK
ncbi:MAG: phosphate-starvation-inducible PsiE family protein [Methanolobus sp.]|nr:phosphate-starvation-inducible PsiE family protein [Methanolobus sp.]